MVTQFQIAALFGSAYLEAATMTNAINSFQKAGVWPVNRNIFFKADFLAAETTDINFSETIPVADTCDMTITSHPCAPASHPLATNTQTSAFSSNLNASNSHTMASTSQSPNCTSTIYSSPSLLSASTSNPNTTSFQRVSPRFIIPVPKQGLQKRLKRQRGKTAILTSSPYKALLLNTLSKNAPTTRLKMTNKNGCHF